jgi:Flp pilus assembly pilin Flp
MKLAAFLFRYALSTRGATAIEYGLIAAGVVLAIAASVLAFGDQVYDLLYEDLPGALEQ